MSARLVVFMAAVAFGMACERGPSPEDSLEALAAAVEAGDRQLAEQYVDVDRTVESAVDQVVAAASVTMRSAAAEVHGGGEGEDPISEAVALGLGIGAAALEAVKPVLTAVLEVAVRQAIGDDPPAGEVEGDYSMFFGSPRPELEELADAYRGVDYVERSGDEARVGVRIYDEESGTVVVPELLLERQDGYWRLVGFTNLDAIMLERIGRELETPEAR